MHQPQQPTSASAPGSRLRPIALASTVALAVALPLAVAVAGPSPSSGGSVGRSALPSPSPSTSEPVIAAPAPSQERVERREAGARKEGEDGRQESLLSQFDVSGLPGEDAGDGRPVTSCGPELAAPDGVQAQTCVLSGNGRTWARSYYRNAANAPLHGALTLMRPDGRTLQTHCELPAVDEPATCETPRERTRGDLGAYTAVAEFASRADEGPLLLRSGSNSGAPAGG